MNRQEKVAVLSQGEILNILYGDCYESWYFLPNECGTSFGAI